MQREKIMPSVVLGAICIVVALLLSVVNLVTAQKILDNQNAAVLEAFQDVLPGATGKVDLEVNENYPPEVKAAYKFDNGFAFQVEVNGYKPGLVILCGIDTEGKVTGMKHIQSSETYGFETQLNSAYNGETLDSAELVIAAGATPKSETSRAYFEAVTAALKAYVVAQGGTVDNRTPEQILNDNCNAALGTTDVKFTKWFATEVISGIDAVYVAENNQGRVFVIGESFVGVAADGTVINGGENTAAASAANAIIAASTVTDISSELEAIKDSLATEKNAKVNSVKKTASGNYVFELSANGHAVKGDHGSGIPIVIRISISADGKIIDVITVSHDETAKIGDVCATEDYYEQYKGKTDDDVKLSSNSYAGWTDDFIPADTTDVGAIAGATNTTLGYQKAVKLAFRAFDLLTEGGNG